MPVTVGRAKELVSETASKLQEILNRINSLDPIAEDLPRLQLAVNQLAVDVAHQSRELVRASLILEELIDPPAPGEPYPRDPEDEDQLAEDVVILDRAYIDAARRIHDDESAVDIDMDCALVSLSDDGGAYVAGWLWVYSTDVDPAKDGIQSRF